MNDLVFNIIYLKKSHKVPFIYKDYYNNYYLVNKKIPFFKYTYGTDYKYSIRPISKIELLVYIKKMKIVCQGLWDYIE